MTATGTSLAAGRTPSISELQAALLAARAGRFATPGARPMIAAAPPPVPARPSAADGGTGVWLLGTHGGSGVRCLSAAIAAELPGSRCAGKLWPEVSPATQPGRDPVVLVCRGNHRGLSSAQDYARAFRDSDDLTRRLRLVGVIVSADAPGRTPLPLRRLERLLSGALPILGHVPWEPTWRVGPPQTLAEPLPWLAALGKSVRAAVAAVAVAAAPA